MFEIYLGLFAACIFSSDYLVGAIMGADGEKKRAVTKIAIANSKTEEWQGRYNMVAIRANDHMGEIRALKNELADRPLPRKRDANGRFVK